MSILEHIKKLSQAKPEPQLTHEEKARDFQERLLRKNLARVQANASNWILSKNLFLPSMVERPSDPVYVGKEKHQTWMGLKKTQLIRLWNKEFANPSNIETFISLLSGHFDQDQFLRNVGDFDYNYLIFMSTLLIQFADKNPDAVPLVVKRKSEEMFLFLLQVEKEKNKGIRYEGRKKWSRKLHPKLKVEVSENRNLKRFFELENGQLFLQKISQIEDALPHDLGKTGIAEYAGGNLHKKYSRLLAQELTRNLENSAPDNSTWVTRESQYKGIAYYVTEQQFKQQFLHALSDLTVLMQQELGLDALKDPSQKETLLIQTDPEYQAILEKMGFDVGKFAFAEFTLSATDTCLLETNIKKLLQDISIENWSEKKADIIEFLELLKAVYVLKNPTQSAARNEFHGQPISLSEEKIKALSAQLKIFIVETRKRIEKEDNPALSWLLRGKKGLIPYPNKPVFGVVALSAISILFAFLESKSPHFGWGEEMKKAVSILASEIPDYFSHFGISGSVESPSTSIPSAVNDAYKNQHPDYKPENSNLGEMEKQLATLPSIYFREEVKDGKTITPSLQLLDRAYYSFDSAYSVNWKSEEFDRKIASDPVIEGSSEMNEFVPHEFTENTAHYMYAHLQPMDAFETIFSNLGIPKTDLDAFQKEAGFKQEKILVILKNIPAEGLFIPLSYTSTSDYFLRIFQIDDTPGVEIETHPSVQLVVTDKGTLLLHIPQVSKELEESSLIIAGLSGEIPHDRDTPFRDLVDRSNSSLNRVFFVVKSWKDTPVDEEDKYALVSKSSTELLDKGGLFDIDRIPSSSSMWHPDVPGWTTEFIQKFGFDLDKIVALSHPVHFYPDDPAKTAAERNRSLYPAIYEQIRTRMLELGFKYSTDTSVNKYLSKKDIRTYFAVGMSVGLDCDGLAFVENLIARAAIEYKMGEDSPSPGSIEATTFPPDFFDVQQYKGFIYMASVVNKQGGFNGMLDHAVLPTYENADPLYDEATAFFPINTITSPEQIHTLIDTFKKFSLELPIDSDYTNLILFLNGAITSLSILMIGKMTLRRAKDLLNKDKRSTFGRRVYEEGRRLERASMRMIPTFTELSASQLAKVPEVIGFLGSIIDNESKTPQIHKAAAQYLVSFEVNEDMTHAPLLDYATSFGFISHQVIDSIKDRNKRRKMKQFVSAALVNPDLSPEKKEVLLAVQQMLG